MQQPQAPIARMSDGRKLAYARYGVADGARVLYFHGTPGSRIEGELLDAAAKGAGVTLVAPDRPGMGLSSFRPRRRIVDWPADACALADHLGWPRFSVCGFSNGSVYALACGAFAADRVESISLIGATEPRKDDRGLRLALMRRTSPPFAWLMMMLAKLPARRMPPGDPSLRPIEMRAAFRAIAQEAFRKGSRGVAHELAMFSSVWGFEPEQVKRPARMWHAEDDRFAPPDGARELARRLPEAELTFVPEGGHYLQPTQDHAIMRDIASTAEVSRAG